jgi:hypothetical protein
MTLSYQGSLTPATLQATIQLRNIPMVYKSGLPLGNPFAPTEDLKPLEHML